jgi:glutamine cyclotransferase
MAKNNKKRRKKNLAEKWTSPPPGNSSSNPTGAKPPMRWGLIALFLAISLGGTYLAIALRPKPTAPEFKAKEIARYPHDPSAFTQGLVWDGDVLWESTGLKGKSTIRKVDFKTGKVLNSVPLKDEYFGEGLVLHRGKLYQQTWKNNKALVYDLDLNQIAEIPYDTEGWGLASDGTHLIFSDGSSKIRFVDPANFETDRTISVFRKNGGRVYELNELEYIGGKIYANRWKSDKIYEIDPKTGNVTKSISLAGLWPQDDRPKGGTMNGIAYNENTGKMLVTGKYCPFIFEVALVPIKK